MVTTEGTGVSTVMDTGQCMKCMSWNLTNRAGRDTPPRVVGPQRREALGGRRRTLARPLLMPAHNWANQTIWTADNLYIMRRMNSESVDLIYLDPPFNSKANYAAPIGSKAAGAAFKDTWTLSEVDTEWINLIEAKHPALYRVLLSAIRKSDKAYLVYMTVRLLEMHRILKSTGTIYLHCDPTMSHFLKLVMDAIFRPSRFLNEIIWRRAASHNDTKQGMSRAGRVHDVLLVYRKANAHTWNPCYTPYIEEYLEDEYGNKTPDGRYFKKTDLTAAKPGGDTSYEWHVKRPYGEDWVADTTDEFKSPQFGWEYVSVPPYKGRYWAYSKDNLMRFWEEGRLYHGRTGMPRLMQFADEMPGIPLQDLWDDISPALGNQRTGFKTQKPVDLLKRIIEVSSNPGDMVLDPFCGCATTLIAAEAFESVDKKRQWVGIDISPQAAELVRRRMVDELGMFFEGSIRTDIPQRTDLGKLPPYRSHRRALYGQQGGNCAGCGEHFQARHLEVDHIISRRNGGTDHVNNLQLLCASCNRIKGHRGMEYLRAKLQFVG